MKQISLAIMVFVTFLSESHTKLLQRNKNKYFEKQGLKPLIIAHRGSMGYFPEHTKLAYYYAHFEGSDFIDIDLQPTKDGHFVVNHDPCFSQELTGYEAYPDIFKEEMKINCNTIANG